MGTHNRNLRRRRYYFLLTLLVPCLLLFLVLPWQAALTLLVLLSIFLADAVEELWKLFQRWPSTPEPTPQPFQTEEEYASYEQGYQEVPSYQPPMRHADEPETSDQPQAEYPQQQYR